MRTLLAFAVVLGFVSSLQRVAVADSPGVTDKEILIGETIGLTGQAAAQCQNHVRGHNLYFDRINREGGINGRKIRVITYDDGYEPSRTFANVQKLIQNDKVFLLFKVYGTAPIKAILPLIEKEDVPVISPSSGAEFLRVPPIRNIFSVKGGYFLESETIVDFLVKRNLRRIAVFYQDDSFGSDGRNGTIKAMAKYGLKPLIEETYKRNSNEFEKSFEEIRSARPDAIILWSVNAPGIEFMKKARSSGLKSLIMGNSSLSTTEYAKNAEGSYLTMGTPLPEDSRFEVARQYRADAAAAGQALDPTSMQSYIDAAVLVEALKKAGKSPTRDSLREAYESGLKGVEIGGLKLHFSKTQHQGLDFVFMAEVKNGQFVPLLNK